VNPAAGAGESGAATAESVARTLTRGEIADLKEQIKRAAPDLGIDEIGFASAEPFFALKDILLRHRALGRESGFEEPDLDLRIYPDRHMDGPRSIIAVAVAYPSKLKDPPKSAPGAYRGMISRSAWGEDYHKAVRRRLERLAAFIRERVPGVRTEIMVDTGALCDRAVAERAGIGYVGKNCSLITKNHGSWVYLGEMLTDIPFEPDEPMTEQCGDCTLCLDACPTGALVGPGQIHAKSCISYLTQTKGFLEDKWKLKIGNRLYGCDTCQVVCPKNKGMNWTHHEDLQPDPEIVKPLLKPLLFIGNRAFKETFGDSAAAWRGKKPIQRNAIIALGHFRDGSAVPDLGRLLHEDPRPEIRGTAAWALGRIGGEEARRLLEEAAERETDGQALEEIRRALESSGATSRE
jgi:epoxyqueuosine reductase